MVSRGGNGPVVTLLAVLAALAWVWLLLFQGGFWKAAPVLPPSVPRDAPDVDVVVPARDEQAVVGRAVASLLAQDYAGRIRVVLVDDGSTDGTGDIARGLRGNHDLAVIDGAARPRGWAGKLWAVHQGVAAGDAPLVLLTDADIEHDPRHVATLVAQAERSGCDMVSEMVRLNCETLPERAMIPAFVYFFAMLYPFAWVNDPMKATAAAAGGTVLIRRAALARIGGIGQIRAALIDDVSLARTVKTGGKIWLGHSGLAQSIRPYPAFADIWRMVARSAYVQLKYSPSLLLGTVLGLALIFLVPPLAALFAHGLARWAGLAAWTMMAGSFLPILRRYGASPLWAPALPLIACFYLAATVGSAFDHHRGQGVVWKSRAYNERSA